MTIGVRRSKRFAVYPRLLSLALLGSFLTVSVGTADVGNGVAAPPGDIEALGASLKDAPVDASVRELIDEARRAMSGGNLDLAAVQLRNALRLEDDPDIRGALGIVLFRLGQGGDAERELREALATGASVERFRPALLDAMVSLQSFQPLLDEFPEPADLGEPGVVDILRARGVAWAGLGRDELAVAELDRALSLKRDITTLVIRARLALQQDDETLARSLAAEASGADPADPALALLRIELARRANEGDEALRLADEQVKRDPSNIVAKTERIGLLIDLGRNDEAERSDDELLARAPKNSLGIYYKAKLRARRGDDELAWRLARALPAELVQSSAFYTATVALIAIRASDLESAETILTTAIARHQDFLSPPYRRLRVLAALVSLRQKRPTEVIEVLRPLGDTDDPEIAEYRAQAEIQRRNFDEATRILAAAGADRADNAQLRQQMVVGQLGAGRTDGAIAELTALFEADPAQVTYASLLVGMLDRLGRTSDAARVADEMARRVGPNSPYPFYFKGDVAAQQGQVEQALVAYGAAIAADREFLPAYFARARLLMTVGSDDAARADIAALAQRDGGHVAGTMLLADLAMREGRDAEVEKIMTDAIAQAPKEARLRLAFVRFLMARGRLDEAHEAARASHDALPKNPDMLMLIGTIELRQAHYREAASSFRLMLTQFPASQAAKDRLVEALTGAGEKRTALSLLQVMAAEQPGDLERRETLIRALLAANHPDQALSEAADFRKLVPGAAGDLLYAETEAGAGRLDEAKATLRAAIEAEDDARLVVRLADFERAPDLKLSRQILAQWVNRHPKDLAARLNLAELLDQAGDRPAAREQYEQLLRDHPSDPIALNNLAWLLREESPERSLDLLRRALTVLPESPQVLDSYGWIDFLAGHRTPALVLLRRAHGIAPDDPQTDYHLSAALRATGGDPAEVKALVTQALAGNAPFDERADAKAMLASLH